MRKTLPLFLLLSLPFLFTACAPSYQALVAFDEIDAMQKTVLLVPLDADWERIERLERYGQERKADRTQRRIDRKNAMFREAFEENFDFCEVRYFYPGELEFVEEQVMAEGFAAPYLVEVRKVWVQENDDNADEEFALGILRNDGSLLPHPFPDEANIGDAITRNNLKFAVRQLNRELNRFETRRVNHLSKKGIQTNREKAESNTWE